MTRAPRAMVIGLDGVPHWLLRRLATEGVMPNAAALLKEAPARPLTAPIPELSCTSWASFLTGNDPGRHGIYGFIDLISGSYRTYLTNFTHLCGPPLWQAVGAAGGASVIVNVPGTFPAPALDGTIVSGFVAPDFQRAVYPARHRGPLEQIGYQLDVEVGDVAADRTGFLERLDSSLAARRAGVSYLLSDDAWRLAVCVITETDRLHHFLWSDLTDRDSPLHPRVLDFYNRVDAAVGEFAMQVGEDPLFLVSDHGFGESQVQFYLNPWLRLAGYLNSSPDVPLEELDESTTAFVLDPGRIYLNTADRFPRGRRISPSEREGLLDELAARLLLMGVAPEGNVVEDGSGTPLVQEVVRGAEVYAGPRVADAPDLVAMPAPGTQIRGAWSHRQLTGPSPLTGTHTQRDGLFWCRCDGADGEVNMRDVAPTVLAVMGLQPPPDVDGMNVCPNHERNVE